MINEIIGSVLQLLVFTAVPFLVFIIRKKSVQGFWEFIGLKSSPTKPLILAALTSLVFLVPPILLILWSQDFQEAFADPKTMTGKFRAMGFGVEAMLLILITALIKTSLSEEILFRGFVGKRLISLLGFQKGNLLQALIFGGIHILIFIQVTDSIPFMAFMLTASTAGAWISGYLNEKMANGSILPGWISHGMANVGAYTIIAFVL